MLDHEILLANMTWQDAERAAAQRGVLLLPIGAIEQHGPHLPLDTDSCMVTWLAEQAARESECAVVAPTLQYGVSVNHIAFAGTATLRPETLSAALVDIGESFMRLPFSALVLLNGNGGNNVAVAFAAAKLRERTKQTVANICAPALVRDAFQLMESGVIWHADESETSMMLAIAPRRVRMELAVREMPKPIPLFEFKEEALTKAMVDLGLPATDAISRSGTIGDAQMARTEKGQAVVLEQVRNLVHVLRTLAAV